MEDDVKVCPGCGSEFFAHIESCSKCDLPLIRPGEKSRVMDEAADSEAALVLLERGSATDMKWLDGRLNKAGFRSQVLNLSGGGCCSSDGFGLFVEEPFAINAMRELERISLNASPELAEMNEQISAGKCPACGANISFSLHNCPDCGLSI